MTPTPARPLRVLFVTNFAQARQKSQVPGIFVQRQQASLRDAGVEVSAFDIGRSWAPLALVRSWRALRAEIRRTRPDLLHAQYGTVVAAVTVLTMHPAVITYGGGDLLYGAVSWPRAFASHALSNFAALFAKGLICVSESLRQAMWWRNADAVVIPRGVNLQLFTPGPRDEARRALGWNPSARIVLIDGGRDAKTKGLDVVTAAVAIAQKTLPDVELHVIREVGPDDMPVLYRASDVLVCASRLEGSPNVVKEALACNLPVIGVRVGDVEERLAGVEPSAIVDRTPEAIAKAIVDITRTPRRSNGREKVEPLSDEHTAQRIVAVYRNALKELME